MTLEEELAITRKRVDTYPHVFERERRHLDFTERLIFAVRFGEDPFAIANVLATLKEPIK